MQLTTFLHKIRPNDIILSFVVVVFYLSTTALIDYKFSFFLILVPLVYLYENNFSLKETFNSFGAPKIQMLLALFIILITANKLLNVSDYTFTLKMMLYMVLYPLNFYGARMFEKNYIRYIVYFLVSIEVLFCIIEYILGVSTVFTNAVSFRHFDSYRLMYYTRVEGLSEGSSILALKIFLTFLMLQAERKCSLNKAFKIFFIIGLILTFNRTVFIGGAVYLIILLFLKLRTSMRNNDFSKFLSFKYLILLVFIIFIVPEIEFQLMRGSSMFVKESSNVDKQKNPEVEDPEVNSNDDKHLESEMNTNKMLSGRKEIWINYASFIRANFFFGNSSVKYKHNGLQHAHNSYLQIAATHGLLIASVLVLIVILSINSINYIYVVSILFLGIFQYLLFWNISYFDVIFFAIAFWVFPLKKNSV